jgi:hypothetical protein
MKEQIKKLMRENGMVATHEVEAAINLVADLLDIFADNTEETEPYATNWITDTRKAASRVHDLHDFVNEHVNS